LTAALVLIVFFAVYCFTLGDHPPGLPPGASPMDFDPPTHQPARPAALLLGFGVLTIIANVGANAIVENERKEAERRLLEIANLRLELESLRYQINPHFFLNTLNNIQALVLLDPGKATESIGVFSKLMQLVLSRGDAPMVPFADEICALDYFISLMRLRYPDNVKIETDFPQQTGDALVQPVVLSTFVENAFKHGISYDRPSFVKVGIELQDGSIVFRCENSLHPDLHSSQSYGIGLENARKRLALLYGDRCRLSAGPEGDRYVVCLTLPDKISLEEGLD